MDVQRTTPVTAVIGSAQSQSSRSCLTQAVNSVDDQDLDEQDEQAEGREEAAAHARLRAAPRPRGTSSAADG